MGIEALATLPRSATSAAVASSCELLALALSRLLRRPVGGAAARDRAVGLGLLRLPPAGVVARLSAEKASRLLLVGYRLPALAEPATPVRAREHLAAGRSVIVLGETEAVPLHALPPGAEEPACDGRLMVAAAHCWDDLPASGPRFFGGTRERDGSYHWDAADCDTDAAGRVLRAW